AHAERADLTEAHIVENDEQDIGRTVFSAQRLGPRRLRYIERPPDHAAKRGSGFVFFKCHKNSFQIVTLLRLILLKTPRMLRHAQHERKNSNDSTALPFVLRLSEDAPRVFQQNP